MFKITVLVELRSSRGADTDIYYRSTFYIASYSGSDLTLDEQDRSRFRNFASATNMLNLQFRHGTIVKTDDDNKVYIIKEDLVNVSSRFPLATQVELGNIVELGGGGEDELPTGGATGQVLGKASAADGDVEWVNLPVGGGNINTDSSISGDGSAGNPLSAEIVGPFEQWTSSNDFNDLSDELKIIWYQTTNIPSNAPVSTSTASNNAVVLQVVATKTSARIYQSALNLATGIYYFRLLSPTSNGWSGWVTVSSDRDIPTGGTTGQVLAKKSATDRDTEWIDAASGGGTVSTDASISGDGSSSSPLSAEIVGLSETWTSSNDFNNLTNSVRMIGYETTNMPSNAPVTTSPTNAVLVQVTTSKTNTRMSQTALELTTGTLYTRLRTTSAGLWGDWLQVEYSSIDRPTYEKLTDSSSIVGSNTITYNLPTGLTLADIRQFTVTWGTSSNKTGSRGTNSSNRNVNIVKTVTTRLPLDATNVVVDSFGAGASDYRLHVDSTASTNTTISFTQTDANTGAGGLTLIEVEVMY